MRRERGDASQARLEWICDGDTYVHVIAQRTIQNSCFPVPVLAKNVNDLRGFGNLQIARHQGLVAAPVEAQSRKDIAKFLKRVEARGKREALCVAVNDPLCLAVAALLCLARQKRFVSLPTKKNLRGWISNLVTRHSPRSITFVVPPLLGARKSDPAPTKFLNSLILALRDCVDNVDIPSFGIVSGVDYFSLTQLAAKSALSQPIAEHYASGTVCFADEDGSPADLKEFRPHGSARDLSKIPDLEIRPLSTLSQEKAPRFAKSKKRLLAIKGHGRNYCMSKGFLCAARHIDEVPERPVNHCVANFSCVGPEFLRFDPRRLDARLLVLHACDTLGLEAGFWHWGNAAVGFLAAAGYPSAVIAGDGMVVPLGTRGMELMATLVGCTTVGEWTRQINTVMQGPNPPLSFILIGDPDLGLGIDPTPWVVDAAVMPIPKGEKAAGRSWRLIVPKGQSLFVRAKLGRHNSGGDELLYLWPESRACSLAESVLVSHRGQQTAWLAISSKDKNAVCIRAELRPPIKLPPDRILAVNRALDSSPDYLDSVLKKSWTAVEIAGEQVVNLGCRQFHANGRTAQEDPYATMADLTAAEALWEAAQSTCLSGVTSKHMPQIYLPAALWHVEMDSVRAEDRRCPMCGSTHLLARDYRSGRAGWRSYYDCPKCYAIVEDKPFNVPSVLSRLDAPSLVPREKPIVIEIKVTNPNENREAVGVLNVSLDSSGHGLRPDRGLVTFRLPPRAAHKIKVRLLPTGEPVTPHLYNVRALALFDGQWYWRSRRLVVADRPIKDGPLH
jgi:ribosomal protein S27AE